MDPPFIWGGELSNEVVLNEELDDLFAQALGCKGLDGRSFPLDLEGDILDGLLGHPVILLVCVLQLRRTSQLQTDRLPEEARSWAASFSLLVQSPLSKPSPPYRLLLLLLLLLLLFLLLL